MSAFSRGCLLRHQFAFTPRTIHLLFSSKSFQSPQMFSTTPFHLAKQKIKIVSNTQAIKATPQKAKSSFTPKKPTTPPISQPPIQEITRQTIYQTYATTLAQKSHPTLIYQAPSHTAFLVASYSTSAFCFTYAVLSYWNNTLNCPPEVDWRVPIAFTGISFLMACFGGWLFLGPARLIRTITAIPKHTRAISSAAAVKTVPELQVEVVLRKMLPVPFFPARVLYVKPGDLVLARPLLPPPSRRLTPEEELARQIKAKEAAKAAHEYEKNHIMTRGLRDMNRAFSQAFYNLFKAIGRTWTREGFLKVEVKGATYKLDVTGGWALDGGRALDRLSKVKP